MLKVFSYRENKCTAPMQGGLLTILYSAGWFAHYIVQSSEFILYRLVLAELLPTVVCSE